jgi:hypothetical protein
MLRSEDGRGTDRKTGMDRCRRETVSTVEVERLLFDQRTLAEGRPMAGSFIQL